MYLYYPHAPILLRVVRHNKRASRVLGADGGYRWKGGGREGHLTNTDAEALVRLGILMILSDEEAAELQPRLPDLAQARIDDNLNTVRRQAHGRLAVPQKRRTRRI